GISLPNGVVVDASGNVFEADYGSNTVKEILAGGNTTITLNSGIINPYKMTIDAAGDLIVADFSSPSVKKVIPVGGYNINKFLPPGLSFDNVTGIISGKPTAVSPATTYVVSAYNIGGRAAANVSIQVAATASTDAYLKALTINGTLSPAFVKTTLSYTVTVANNVTEAILTPTVNAPGSYITVNGGAVASGIPTEGIPLAVGLNTINVKVTAQDGVTVKTYVVKVTRVSNNAVLSSLTLTPVTTLTNVSGADYRDYTTTVPNSESTVKITPTAQDATATIKVNGVTVASGAASASIPLNVGDNVINTVITAQDGVTIKTYSIKFTRLPSANANLAGLTLSSGTLSPVFAAATTSYTASVNTATVSITPTAADAGATIKVNGTTVASGSASAALPLVVGPNVINTVVTAQDGVTTKTYKVTVTLASNNALLTSLKLTPATTLTVVSGADYRDYATTVPNSESTVKLTPTAQDGAATIKVNGVTVASGVASNAIALNVGTTVINTVVTAPDGVTVKTYSITFTRPGPIARLAKYDQQGQPITDALTVHQNVSPNGDGNSDVLVIDGIAAYPDNKLQIMSRNGALVYEAKGYDNATKAFDGHSSTNGKLQQAGTYFYSLEYKDGGETKRKTGFIVLKY
ncbi:MAG: cadherin-like beta sandwich domain-containing protein, partial [Mucilaginibacter sp.]